MGPLYKGIPYLLRKDAVNDGYCPDCHAELWDAGGIGLFCPNDECDTSDDLLGAVELVCEPTIKDYREALRHVLAPLGSDNWISNDEARIKYKELIDGD